MRTHVPIVRPERKKKPVSRLQRGGRIKPVSATKAKLQKIYSALRRDFLERHPYCQWWLGQRCLAEYELTNGVVTVNGHYYAQVCPRSDQVHHKRGRGKYYLDTSTWMAVSSAGHRWIHDNPKLAYEKMYMLPRN